MRRATALSWVLLVPYLFLLANRNYYFQRATGHLRASCLWLDASINAIVLLFPLVVLIIRIKAPYPRSRWYAVVALTMTAVCSTPLAIGVAFTALFQQPLLTVSRPKDSILFLRQLLGPFDTSVCVYQETSVFPGLSWSERIYCEHRSDSVTVIQSGDQNLDCIFLDEYDPSREDQVTLRIPETPHL